MYVYYKKKNKWEQNNVPKFYYKRAFFKEESWGNFGDNKINYKTTNMFNKWSKVMFILSWYITYVERDNIQYHVG